MQVLNRLVLSGIIAAGLLVGSAQAEEAKVPVTLPAKPAPIPAKPYRAFVTIQRYNMENNGEPGSPISNVRLEIAFPNGHKLQLPEGGQYWPIGNNQVQEINRTFEIPWAWIQNDGFMFTVKMVRKGSDLLPCQFEVTSLSQFNRGYTCHTDTAWQQNERISAEQMDREGIQVRVFSDLNSAPKEIPTDAVAIK